MPRGNPSVWKQHGSSYAELSGTKTSAERASELALRRLPPVGPCEIAAVHATRPAGAPAGTLPRGAGTFQLQATWSISAPAGAISSSSTGTGTGPKPNHVSPGSGTVSATTGAAASSPGARCGGTSRGGGALFPASAALVAEPAGGAAPARSYATETRVNYGPPPAGYRRTQSAGAAPAQMPKPNYPNDWCTVKQADYRPDAAARAERQPPFRPRDAGRLLPTDVPPGSQFASTARAAHGGRGLREARSLPPSGAAATRAAGYNIITGGAPLGNGAFEAWDGRDYRRHR